MTASLVPFPGDHPIGPAAMMAMMMAVQVEVAKAAMAMTAANLLTGAVMAAAILPTMAAVHRQAVATATRATATSRLAEQATAEILTIPARDTAGAADD